ncbi:hypothetical protein J5A56_01335 [Prevotella melaninogenica]|uniref:hypothetical protein n=1 Tax=Prevotella TaxID=838 RepID=UPI0003AD2B59|nr:MULTISPECIES: hypothetical protein [Prevotella]ERJ73698.1 hypothetical protein HMPREF9148_02501 [Prevotella sp. F0091]QUB73064.1 hypothetical protein J5A56_01335 [Prevotella melaninogenica]
MATFLDKLKKRLQTWHEERADRMENKRQALLAVYDLNETLPEVVSHARQNYKDWKEEKLWEK